jgi:hypothetical protein
VRTAWFFLTLLAIPLTSVLGRRSRRLRSTFYRWGERGTASMPGRTLDPEAEAAIAEAQSAREGVPATVRRGMLAGALLGALPGVWSAARGAQLELARGEGAATVAATVGIALGLVAGAGVVLGAVLGAVVGIAVDAVRERRQGRGERRPT